MANQMTCWKRRFSNLGLNLDSKLVPVFLQVYSLEKF